ncbi:hypothetical protein B0H67DRAFT_647917 [Lasiosphaeris hirsuta]|uniref:Uncharacterized protein n=1 Tax=Lasiosphaeris hirsuta TaxID=260670 RepID=A0AA40A204_9PEZI|nr:hypothetical protein B0H67DRAFT_647917 [Lasiosphaeris hirsuta]
MAVPATFRNQINSIHASGSSAVVSVWIAILVCGMYFRLHARVRNNGTLDVSDASCIIMPVWNNKDLFVHPTIDLPSERLLALHCVTAHILHLSGADDYIDKILRDMEAGVVRGDGSTELREDARSPPTMSISRVSPVSRRNGPRVQHSFTVFPGASSVDYHGRLAALGVEYPAEELDSQPKATDNAVLRDFSKHQLTAELIATREEWAAWEVMEGNMFRLISENEDGDEMDAEDSGEVDVGDLEMDAEDPGEMMDVEGLGEVDAGIWRWMSDWCRSPAM